MPSKLKNRHLNKKNYLAKPWRELFLQKILALRRHKTSKLFIAIKFKLEN